MKKLYLKAIEKITEILYSDEYLKRSRLNNKNFTRNRSLSFLSAMGIILNLCRKSLQTEVYNFFDKVKNGAKPVSKQAFSKARQNILPEAFQELYQVTVKESRENKLNTYNGYNVYAIDGSTLALENEPELIEYFHCSGSAGSACTARISFMQDCLNGVIMDAQIGDYKNGERKLALEHIKALKKMGVNKDILLFDRGYASNKLLIEIIENKIFFIMRIKSRWHGKAIASTKSGDFIKLILDKKEYDIRVIKIPFTKISKDGEAIEEIETLFTNIDFFDTEQIFNLYGLRWGVETSYSTVKEKLQIENFSGKTVVSVLQDFYATVIISNLATFYKIDSDEAIQEQDKEKDNKYQYQTNLNLTIGILRDRLIEAILMENKRKQRKMLKKLFIDITHLKTQIRPNRTVPRKNPRQGKGFFMRKKSSI